MKAISVRQPWASLIVQDIKPIENRTWKTNYRGRVLVHAPLKVEDVAFSLEQLDMIGGAQFPYPLPVSAIIGSVEIVDCIKDSKSIWAMKDHWHWVLANPIKFKEPILNVKGKLSFWEYEGVINE